MEDITTIEWLYEHLFPKQLDGFSEEEWKKIDTAFTEAKEMEKQQIIKAFQQGETNEYHLNYMDEILFESAEQYYNKTYKNK